LVVVLTTIRQASLLLPAREGTSNDFTNDTPGLLDITLAKGPVRAANERPEWPNGAGAGAGLAATGINFWFRRRGLRIRKTSISRGRPGHWRRLVCAVGWSSQIIRSLFSAVSMEPEGASFTDCKKSPRVSTWPRFTPSSRKSQMDHEQGDDDREGI